METKKSSAVPKRPTAVTLAPSDSRYFGRNFFQSSSPSPTRNTAPEAAATLRSIPRDSVIRSSMQSPTLLDPSCGSSAESQTGLSALHHLFAVFVERIVNNPLGRVDCLRCALRILQRDGEARKAPFGFPLRNRSSDLAKWEIASKNG